MSKNRQTSESDAIRADAQSLPQFLSGLHKAGQLKWIALLLAVLATMAMTVAITAIDPNTDFGAPTIARTMAVCASAAFGSAVVLVAPISVIGRRKSHRCVFQGEEVAAAAMAGQARQLAGVSVCALAQVFPLTVTAFVMVIPSVMLRETDPTSLVAIPVTLNLCAVSSVFIGLLYVVFASSRLKWMMATCITVSFLLLWPLVLIGIAAFLPSLHTALLDALLTLGVSRMALLDALKWSLGSSSIYLAVAATPRWGVPAGIASGLWPGLFVQIAITLLIFGVGAARSRMLHCLGLLRSHGPND